MITGEYFVLKEAKALAIPLRFFQKMVVIEQKNINSNTFSWIFSDINGIILVSVFSKDTLTTLYTNNASLSSQLENILQQANKLGFGMINRSRINRIECVLNFNIDWGLGSSSTLISNLAYWLDIDPYGLSDLTFKSSGYDIASARSSTPVLYQRSGNDVKVSNIDLNNSYLKHAMFIYSGKSQNTQENTKNISLTSMTPAKVGKVSTISDQIIQVHNYQDFRHLIIKHENIISKTLKLPSINDYFNDFDGVVKSLGAWGGDFFMAASEHGKDYIVRYFNKKGYQDIFSYNDIIYTK